MDPEQGDNQVPVQEQGDDLQIDEQQQNNNLVDIRKAFQASSAQLTALLLLALGYVVIQMLDEVINPLFWAFLVSLLLRGLSDKINGFLLPLRNYDDIDNCSDIVRKLNRYKVPSFILIPFQKFFSSYYSFRKLILLGGVLVTIPRIACFVLDWSCSSVFFWLYIGTVLFLGLLSGLIACTKGDNYAGLVSMILVSGLIFFIFIFVFFFSFQFIHETGTFVLRLKDSLNEVYQNQDLEKFINSTGITPDLLDGYYATAKNLALEFTEAQGYNMTELMDYKKQYLDDLDFDMEEVAEKIQETLQAVTSLNYEKVREYWDSAQEIDTNLPGEIANYAFSTGVSVFSTAADFAAPLLGMVDNILDFAVFLGGLFFFLEMEVTLVDYLAAILPIPPNERKKVSQTIQKNVEQIFVCSFLLCVSHGVATWIYFTILGLDFAYSAAFIVGIMSIFPFLSPWMIFGPALGMLYLQGSPYVLYYGVGIYLSQWLIEGHIDDQIFEIIPDSNPYLTGLAIALGFSEFGMSGILVGPMLVVFLKSIYQIFVDYIQ